MGSSTFLKLLAEDQVGRVTRGFMEVISQSFQEDNARQTQAEIKRRFDLCAAAFEDMRGGLKWSLERCLDELHGALRQKLDGVPWKPDARSSWTPREPGVIVSPHTGRIVRSGVPLTGSL